MGTIGYHFPTHEHYQSFLSLSCPLPPVPPAVERTDQELDILIAIIDDNREALIPFEESKQEIDAKLSRHTECEAKLREAKKIIKEIKDRKEDLVEKAREKITPDQARELILARWKGTLHTTIMAYVADYQREFFGRLENLWEKYTTTINYILAEREKESAQLNTFLRELGYE